jgi:2-polyprenyl-3-methyl-5-hydroxy-6-metoxy-1,4-benzoquinol methylase
MEKNLFHHFSKEDYWREFYKANKKECEWIESWEQVRDPLRKYLFEFPKLRDIRFLDVGCGLSSIMERVFEWGVDHVTGLDFNKEVVNLQTLKFASSPNFQCECPLRVTGRLAWEYLGPPL